MSYYEIQNLYKSKNIMEFKRVYAMEKIHGTSAHINWKNRQISFFPGGVPYPLFVKIFDQEKLKKILDEKFGERVVVVYGEAYGGSCQSMSDVYGPDLKFVCFEVTIDENWLNVPSAERVVLDLGLEFVDYRLIETTIEALDAEGDRPSVQAARNGMGENHQREGIVLRPPFELRYNNGDRIIAKHKAEKFRETKNPRRLDSEKLEVLTRAEEIADEWVTPMRLDHVLDAFPNAGVEQIGNIIRAMVFDIEKEAGGEVENFKEAKKAIGKKTAELFKSKIKYEFIREFSSKVSAESDDKINKGA